MDQIKLNSEINLEFGDEKAILFDGRMGKAYRLNDTAAVILKVLTKTSKTEYMVSELVEKFNVNEEEAEKDVRQFLYQLTKLNLVRVE